MLEKKIGSLEGCYEILEDMVGRGINLNVDPLGTFIIKTADEKLLNLDLETGVMYLGMKNRIFERMENIQREG